MNRHRALHTLICVNRLCRGAALLLFVASCTPAQQQVAGQVAAGAGRAVLSIAKCLMDGNSPTAKYLAASLAQDPSAAARFKASLAEGQVLRQDIACGLYALASAGSQDGPQGSPSDRVAARAEACLDGGCKGDARGLAAQLLIDAHRRGLLQLPSSGEG